MGYLELNLIASAIAILLYVARKTEWLIILIVPGIVTPAGVLTWLACALLELILNTGKKLPKRKR